MHLQGAEWVEFTKKAIKAQKQTRMRNGQIIEFDSDNPLQSAIS